MPKPLYRELRARFYEEPWWSEFAPAGTPKDERLVRPEALDNALNERQQLLDALEGFIGWNDDAPPKEYDRLLAKVLSMRDSALYAKYLPAEGPLDVDKVPQKDAERLMARLPHKEYRSALLPKADRPLMYFRPYGDSLAEFRGADVKSGKFGNKIRKLYESGAMKTVGDWEDALAKNMDTVPKDEREFLKFKLRNLRRLDEE